MSLIKLIPIAALGDERGSLISMEANMNVPFDIERVYCLFDTHEDVSRGFHAHKTLKQVVICLSGSCKFVLDDGEKREQVLLDRPTTGLVIEGLIWREMHDFSSNCVLMVLADQYYDESDYIRNYQRFLEAVNHV